MWINQLFSVFLRLGDRKILNQTGHNSISEKHGVERCPFGHIKKLWIPLTD
jgi:hypothetical protein